MIEADAVPLGAPEMETGETVTPAGARAAAWISLTLWTGVVFAGRGIAYY